MCGRITIGSVYHPTLYKHLKIQIQILEHVISSYVGEAELIVWSHNNRITSVYHLTLGKYKQTANICLRLLETGPHMMQKYSSDGLQQILSG